MTALDDTVDLAPGAEDNPLAVWACTRIRSNLRRSPALRRDYEAMRAAVALVAPDRRLQATLRFDHGELTIHDGMIGVPDVTFCGDETVLRELGRLPWWRSRLPDLRRRSWRNVLLEVVGGQVKVYGLFAHARLVTRVLRILAGGDAPDEGAR